VDTSRHQFCQSSAGDPKSSIYRKYTTPRCERPQDNCDAAGEIGSIVSAVSSGVKSLQGLEFLAYNQGSTDQEGPARRVTEQ
jgi:hypothetical protein